MNDSISEEAKEAASLELLEEITARSHPIGYHVQAAIAAALQAAQKPHTVTEATMVKALIPDNEDAIQILAAIARAKP